MGLPDNENELTVRTWVCDTPGCFVSTIDSHARTHQSTKTCPLCHKQMRIVGM